MSGRITPEALERIKDQFNADISPLNGDKDTLVNIGMRQNIGVLIIIRYPAPDNQTCLASVYTKPTFTDNRAEFPRWCPENQYNTVYFENGTLKVKKDRIIFVDGNNNYLSIGPTVGPIIRRANQ